MSTTTLLLPGMVFIARLDDGAHLIITERFTWHTPQADKELAPWVHTAMLGKALAVGDSVSVGEAHREIVSIKKLEVNHVPINR